LCRTAPARRGGSLCSGRSRRVIDHPGSTTSVENSGLLGAILPSFTKATNISVKILAQGTGQALDTARRGDADLVLVHDPEAEAKFIGDGHGINRRQIAWNDFVIVGPKADQRTSPGVMPWPP